MDERRERIANTLRWLRNRLIVIAVLLFVITVIGYFLFRVGPHAVTNGLASDTVSNTEELGNGFYLVWVTHDEGEVYCTNNRDFFETARHYQIGLLSTLISYSTFNLGDFDRGWWGCDVEIPNARTVRMTNIWLPEPTSEPS